MGWRCTDCSPYRESHIDEARLRPRHAWLAVLLILHLAALLTWRQGARVAPPAPAARGELIFVLPPPAQPASRAEGSPAPRPKEKSARRVEPEAITVAPVVTAPPIEAGPVVPPDPFSESKPLAVTAREAVASTMKSLQKERPHAFLSTVQSAGTIERALAKVAGSSGTRLEEVTLPDGRRMTRVRAGGSSYCVVMDSPAGSAGRDVFRDGVKARTVTCP
jgi:hypothetical protein